MDDLQQMYQRRFGKDAEFRQGMYTILCEKVFQKYIPEQAVVLDVPAGYCEFINKIRAAKKIALDINPDVKLYAHSDVEVMNGSATAMTALKDERIDVVFTSNFFEHLTREDIVKTMQEVRRILKPGGKFLILQPNIRYAYKNYWMFFDHITPIDDRSLCEALELHGFTITECYPQFLPYSTKSLLPKSLFLVRMYLALPFAQRLVGGQAFVVAQKK